jgi:osmotically-inducible protein OsmY
MANDDQERRENRGMFGYEGEGFMRGSEEYDDFARQGYGRGSDDVSFGFSGGYGTGRHPADREIGEAEQGAVRGWNIGRDSEDQRPRPSYRGVGPRHYRRSDERIREDVCERLAMDHDIDASDIEVKVGEGIVRLEGTVSERRAKRLAEDISELVRGVRDVENHLRVARPDDLTRR